MNSIQKFENEEIIERYLNNYSDSIQSVKMRKSSLKYFFDKSYFDFQKHISEIIKSTLLDYFDYLKHLKNLTLDTKKNKWRILTSFLEFSMEYYDDFSIIIPKKTVNWGNNHKVSESNSAVIADEDEVKAILDYLFERNYKMYLIFRLFAETGMRKGEMINVRLDEVNIEERYLKTSGKTGRKMYFFSTALARHLALYVNSRAQLNTTQPYLFLTNRNYKYSNRRFNQLLKVILDALNIKKNITTKTYRKTINTIRKKKMKCDNETCKRLVGHASKESKMGDVNIDNYTIYDIAEVRELFDQFYPYAF